MKSRTLFIKLINLYQLIPKRPSCRFHPTCSEYAKQAIEKYGVLKGIRMGTGRVLRCHPFAKGGVDPVE